MVDTLTLGGRIPRKDVHMPKSHAPYPPEFRAEAIRLVRTSGRPMSHIARDVGITGETLRLWMMQADIDDGLRHDGLTTQEIEEVRCLRREVKTLREHELPAGGGAARTSQETLGRPVRGHPAGTTAPRCSERDASQDQHGSRQRSAPMAARGYL